MIIIALFFILTAISLPFIKTVAALLIRTGIASLASSAILVINTIIPLSIGSGVTIYSELLQVSHLTQTIELILLTGGIVAIAPWAPLSLMFYQSSSPTLLPTISTYPLFILFTTAGGSLLISSYSLITIYLAVELQSFAVYVLAAIYRDSDKATKSSLLYFMLGGLSSTLILLGSALIYSSTGTTNLEHVLTLISTQDVQFNTTVLGFVVLVSGFLFKITAAPFHNWGPDVYDGVPTIVTTWLAVLPKISLLGLLIELSISIGDKLTVEIVSTNTTVNVWGSVLTVSALLSLIAGTVVGLAQTRIKRLLAYSTVSHVGFMLLALSINTTTGTEAAMFYLGQYTLTALNSFIILLGLGYTIKATNVIKQTSLKNNDKEYSNADIGFVQELSGAFTKEPLLGAGLVVCLFSIAGVPPLIGFFAKQTVLSSAMSVNSIFIALVAIVTSVVSASYYLRVIRTVQFESSTEVTQNKIISKIWEENEKSPNNLEPKKSINPNKDLNNQKEDLNNQDKDLTILLVEDMEKITKWHSYVIGVFTLILVFFIAESDQVFNSIRLLSLDYYNA